MASSSQDTRQQLSDQLSAQHLASQAEISDVRKTIVSSSQGLERKLVETHQANEKRFEEANRNNQRYFDDTRGAIQCGTFLESLIFPDIHLRQNTIKDAAPDTFDWILDETNDNSGSNFREWLTEDSSTYWISGKAGSGKSTLMAYLVEQNRTRRALETWAENRTLYILSFFFWRPGSELQRSILGLLRSLLYQICNARSDLIGIIMDHMSLKTKSTLR